MVGLGSGDYAKRHNRQVAAADRALIQKIRQLEGKLAAASRQELADRVDDLRSKRCQRGGDWLTDESLCQASTLVVIAAREAIGVELYDVQLLAGLALARGTVAEMATGEGKTFAAAIPAFIHSLAGRGVHVSTSNEYLSKRDCDLLRPMFEFLDTSCGHIASAHTPSEKAEAYRCDITYGAGAEFGFDYLRDQVALRQSPQTRLGEDFLGILRGHRDSQAATMQRGLAVAIVDEIDNVLIDDAGSPLLLSGAPDGPASDAEAHLAARRMADTLVEQQHFSVDSSRGSIELTDAGKFLVHEATDSAPLKCLLRPWTAYVTQALLARVLFHRDVHYLVRDEQVVIVDQSTGRLFEERTWRDGLHQAIEAREGLPITGEKIGMARISKQRFFRLYPILCGMTGTATGSEKEFAEFYRLSVSPVPLRKASQRVSLPDRCFVNADSKWAAIARDVKRIHETGQPVLVGTRSIAKSEIVAERLRDLSVPFELLNGKQDADEAEVISRAGCLGAVTISTSIAGRGTDIRPERESLEKGGLCVLATEHFDSSRIDRQLVGRSARQGEPGSAGYYIAADDDLLVRHGDWLTRVITKSKTDRGEVAVSVAAPIRKVQREAERVQFLQRRSLFLEDSRRDVLMSRLSGEAS